MTDPRLPIFLGELRQGSDLRSAAVVAEMSIDEATAHAAADARGAYADVEIVPPIWRVEGDALIFTFPRVAREIAMPFELTGNRTQ